jgi:hypothetical protein
MVWAGGVAQVVEHLLSKCEALNLNTSIAKKKKLFQDNTNLFFSGEVLHLLLLGMAQFLVPTRCLD